MNNRFLIFVFSFWLASTTGCRVPVLDPTRNIVDGVPMLGSGVCCPPEDYPDAGAKLGKADIQRYGRQVVCEDALCTKLESWHDGPDCDGRWLVLERLIGRKRVQHCGPIQLASVRNAGRTNIYGPKRDKCYDDKILDSAFIFLTFNKKVTLDGLEMEDVDIVAHNGSAFAQYFDGSDVGLDELEMDAFCILDDRHILVSFSKDFQVDVKHALPGIVGEIDNSDLLMFTANSLGPITRGTFSMYVDGSDLGLKSDSENIDAVTVSDDGRVFFSTSGDVKAGKASGSESDIFVFLPEQLGDETIGSVRLYLDTSRVEPESSPLPGINAIDIDADGRIFLSLADDYQSSAMSGARSDVLQFVPEEVGVKTEGEFLPAPWLHGHHLGIADKNIIAMDLLGGPHPIFLGPEEKDEKEKDEKEKDEKEKKRKGEEKDDGKKDKPDHDLPAPNGELPTSQKRRGFESYEVELKDLLRSYTNASLSD